MFFSSTVHTFWEQRIKASMLSVCVLFKWLSPLALWEFNIPSDVWRKTLKHKNRTSDNIKLLLSNKCTHLPVYRCVKQSTVEFYKQIYSVSKASARKQIERCSVITVPASECSTAACLCCRTSTAAQGYKSLHLKSDRHLFVQQNFPVTITCHILVILRPFLSLWERYSN